MSLLAILATPSRLGGMPTLPLEQTRRHRPAPEWLPAIRRGEL